MNIPTEYVILNYRVRVDIFATVFGKGAECLFATNFEGGRIGTKTGEVWGIYDKNEDAEPYWHCEEAVTLRKQMEAFMLKPRPDVVVYSDKQYTTEFLRDKYEPFICKKIENKKSKKIRYVDTGKLKNIDDIITITRFERRYEPAC